MDKAATNLIVRRMREGLPTKCHICGKEILSIEVNSLEYVRTKKKEDLFMHKKCFNKLLEE